MKILLITSSLETESGLPQVPAHSHYPLGLAYMHSYLEGQGHDVTTLFLNPVSPEEGMKTIDSMKIPDVIGLQILTFNRVSSYRIIEEYHKKYPQVPIIIGGIHTTVMYRQILTKYPFLMAVLGEGELTFSEFLAKDLNPHGIDGMAFVDGGKIVTNPMRDQIRDLDILPFPKHDLFWIPGRDMAGMLTSRGCYFRCSFCVLDAVSLRKVRFRSVKNVVDELEYLVDTFPSLRWVGMVDDNFLANNERAIAICDEIVKRGIKTKFVAAARLKPLTPKVVSALESAGFFGVAFGLESGSRTVLDKSKKMVTPEDAIRCFELFKDSKVRIDVFLMVGLEGETVATIKETGELVQKLQKLQYWYVPYAPITMVYPGTQLYQIMVDTGKITDDYWLSDAQVPFFTAEHSEEKLEKLRNLLLDYISLNRMFTFKGLKKQYRMIPTILRLVWTDPKKFVNIVKELVFAAFPGVAATARQWKREYVAWRYCSRGESRFNSNHNRLGGGGV